MPVIMYVLESAVLYCDNVVKETNEDTFRCFRQFLMSQFVVSQIDYCESKAMLEILGIPNNRMYFETKARQEILAARK